MRTIRQEKQTRFNHEYSSFCIRLELLECHRQQSHLTHQNRPSTKPPSSHLHPIRPIPHSRQHQSISLNLRFRPLHPHLPQENPCPEFRRPLLNRSLRAVRYDRILHIVRRDPSTNRLYQVFVPSIPHAASIRGRLSLIDLRKVIPALAHRISLNSPTNQCSQTPRTFTTIPKDSLCLSMTKSFALRSCSFRTKRNLGYMSRSINACKLKGS